MPTFIFAMKQYLHLHSLWRRTIICLCNEAALALFSCHKATLTFYLHWGHIYISFISKLCQHSSFSWSHNNTSFASKPCQRSTLHSYQSYANVHLCNEVTTTIHISTCICIEVAPIFALSHIKTSFAPKPCQHSWSHEVTSTLHISTEVMPILVFAMKLR